MVVTGSDYVSFAPILCGWPHSGSCVSRSEGPLENDGAMGIFGLDDFFFFAFSFSRFSKTEEEKSKINEKLRLLNKDGCSINRTLKVSTANDSLVLKLPFLLL